MDTLFQDVRYAVRRLARSPGFTLVAVLTLALGIGANSAIFSVVNAVLLRSLPYGESERLVRVFHVSDDGSRNVMSPQNFRDARSESRSFEELTYYQNNTATLTGAGDPVELEAGRVGPGFFEVMRTKPALGRAFRPDENESGQHRVAILSDGLWKERFGGKSEVVGGTITLNGEPYEVVGVTPEGFAYPPDREIWLPMEHDEFFSSEESRGAWFISAIGRLKPGATVEQAASELRTIASRLEREFPDVNTGLSFGAFPLHEVMVGDVQLALWVLLGAVGLVLLIACANVANLMLARAAARESELAVRTALGAGRGRLVRQMITESVMLALLGGTAGLLLAVWGTALLIHLQPEVLPRLADVRVDGTVVLFTAGLALLASLLFGLAPALQVTSGKLASTIRAGGRGALSIRSGNRVRGTLVVAEMALSVMLLAGAGLLIKSFARLQAVDPGFATEGLVTFGLALPEAAYEEDEKQVAFHEGMAARLSALPGVRSVGAVSDLPLSGGVTYLTFRVAGQPEPANGQEPAAQILRVSPDYFRTMQIPVRKGRVVEPTDRAGSPPVVVINEKLAEEYFGGADPLGQQIMMSFEQDVEDFPWQVVGVVGNVQQFGLDAEMTPMAYFPEAQAPTRQMDYVVSTSVPPLSLAGAIRREVRSADANLPVTDLQTVERRVSESISQPRFYTLLLTIFAGVALVLAAIGIFGVVSYGVSQRTREIGVRMALGAHPRSILRTTVGGSLLLGGIGVAAGLVGALIGTRILENLLFGVGTSDPLTFAAVAAILLAVAAVASYLPARRATRVDPMVALRTE